METQSEPLNQKRMPVSPENRSARPGSLRSMFFNLLLTAVVLLLCAIAMEGALRVLFARSLDFSIEMWKYAVQLKRPVDDPQLGFAHAPNRSAFLMGVPVSINSRGYRDAEYSEAKPAGTYRIIALGDSTTFGWGAPIEQTAAKILERKLNQTTGTGYSRFEVINAGVGNYGSVQEVAHYRTYDRAMHPDAVVLEYFINDPEPVPRERGLGTFGHSYLLTFALSRFDTLSRLTGVRPDWKQYYAGLYREGQPGLQPAQNALRELAAITQRDGTTLLVAFLPELHQINGEYPFEREHRMMKTVLDTEGVPSIELIDGLRNHGPENSLWVTPADSHPNGKANTLIADQMAAWILDTLKHPRNGPK